MAWIRAEKVNIKSQQMSMFNNIITKKNAELVARSELIKVQKKWSEGWGSKFSQLAEIEGFCNCQQQLQKGYRKRKQKDNKRHQKGQNLRTQRPKQKAQS